MLAMMAPLKRPLGKTTLQKRSCQPPSRQIEEESPRESVHVVEEPCPGRSHERAPVVSTDQEVRNILLDRRLAVELRVDHAHSENEYDEREDDGDAEDGSPERVEVDVQSAGRFENDEIQNRGDRSSE